MQSPLINLLTQMGLSPELRSKSDIRIAGKKISGNASHIFKNRVLHHGSILFATDLNLLTNCLKNTPTKYLNNSVQSRRSIVTNISSHLENPMKIVDFKHSFIQMLTDNGLIQGERELEKKAISTIQELIATKYNTTEWNVLYNANYQFRNTFLHEENLIQIAFNVKKGICNTEDSNNTFLKDYQQLIQNVPHGTIAFQKALKGLFTEDEVIEYFF